MKPAPFNYMRPADVADAVVALQRADLNPGIVAGGQSLLVMMSLRMTSLDLLVDVSRLEDLKVVSETDTHVFIGAATTHAMIEDGVIPDPSRGLMRRVASHIAYRAIRNHGTIGGSVALADPAADWPGCLMALDAVAVVTGPSGQRREPVVDFMRGLYSTSLQQGEIILGFDTPKLPDTVRWGVAKVARKSGAFASSIAFVVERADGTKPNVVLGATASHAQPLPRVAACLHANRPVSDDDLRAAIATDLDSVDPDADAYQRRVHTATMLRAIREARA